MKLDYKANKYRAYKYCRKQKHSVCNASIANFLLAVFTKSHLASQCSLLYQAWLLSKCVMKKCIAMLIILDIT